MSSPISIKKRKILSTETEKMNPDLAKDLDRKRFDQSTSGGERSREMKIKDVREFRVYSKAIVSEAKIGANNGVVLSGFGVAILDYRDELIGSISKPLVQYNLRDEEAELKALISGLRLASSLNLERVKVFCYSDSCFQWISKNCPGTEKRLADYRRELMELREKFTVFQPLKVAQEAILKPRNDVNPALKFAQEAIFQQIVKVTGGKEKCFQCGEVTDSKNIFAGFRCLHRYCKECIEAWVMVKLVEAGNVPVCPVNYCRSYASVENCAEFLPPNMTEILKDRIKEDSVCVTDRVYCPYPQCSELMSRRELSRHVNILLVLPRREISLHPKHGIISFAYGISGARKCMKCHGQFCINCMVQWHYGYTCDEYREALARKEEEAALGIEEDKEELDRKKLPPPRVDLALMNLAENLGWRQCVKCNHMINHGFDYGDCADVTCRCGYKFCYRCGGEWSRNKYILDFCTYHGEGICISRSRDVEEYEDEDEDENEEEEN